MNNKQYEKEYSEEKFFKKLAKYAKKVGAKLVYYVLILYYVLQDPAVPAKYKAAIVGALGYFILPFDLIPDIAIGAGYVDDMGVVLGAVMTVIMHITPAVKESAKQKMRDIFGNDIDDLLDKFDEEETRKFFKLMTLNGQTKDAFTKNQAGAWRYDIVDFGMKINLPDINAAVALTQLRKYDYLLEERKRVFELYHKLLSEYHWAILPPKSNNNFKSVYHLFPLRIKPITEQQRNQIIENLSKKEIATNVHYIPMPELTLFKNMGYKIQDYPQAFDAYTREITLPLYPQLTNQQVEYIVRNLVEEYYSVLNKNQ